MKRLIMMRHAKSSWEQNGLDDHARPLNKRGISSAKTMAGWLRSQEAMPDYAIVSDAERTKETWELVSSELGLEIAADYSRKIYLAAPQTMLEAIQDAPDTSDCIILIAHQPGTSILVQRLSDGTETDECSRAYHHYPTAGISLIDFEVNRWADVDTGLGNFKKFAVPREVGA